MLSFATSTGTILPPYPNALGAFPLATAGPNKVAGHNTEAKRFIKDQEKAIEAILAI